MTDKLQETQGYVIFIEWDGGKPPSRFYDYMHKQYHLWSRVGDKEEQSPMARRSEKSQGCGVIFQEGAVIVNSLSAAQNISAEARYSGAVAVLMGPLQVREYNLTAQDEKILEGMHKTWGRRGPKSKEGKGRYTIVCFEEADSYEVDLNAPPTNCPFCGGYHIQWHKGERKLAPMPKDGDAETIFDQWVSSRFQAGQAEPIFEIPLHSPSSDDVNIHADFKADEKIDQVIDFVKQNVDPLKAHKPASGNKIVNLMHAIDIAYLTTRMERKDRVGRRTQALVRYYQNGGMREFPINPPENSLDLVDLAGHGNGDWDWVLK
jgi:hypothetical protein